ncbi:MAG: hypothetical protein ACR2NO_01090 [Chloroflexota bacterium]
MERSHRASNVVYAYAAMLALTSVLLGLEAAQRFRAGAAGWGIFLLSFALAWLGCAGYLAWRWGGVRVILSADALSMKGDGPDRRVAWRDVERIREFRGAAYQLSLRGLLPGPYLPHSLVRGETVLALDIHPATRLLFRQALLDSYNAFRQEVVQSAGREVEVDLHARWWRAEDVAERTALPSLPARVS